LLEADSKLNFLSKSTLVKIGSHDLFVLSDNTFGVEPYLLNLFRSKPNFNVAT